MLGKFLRDESGATAIVGSTGQKLVELFQSLIPALTLP
jgi:hypothetical protein